MTTGAQEVTTVDELQLRFIGGGGVVGGPFNAERGRPVTTRAQEVTTVDELQLRFIGGGVVGGRLTLRGRIYTERGCPITTGALEVTTLQLRFDGGGGGGGGGGEARGPLTFRCCTL